MTTTGEPVNTCAQSDALQKALVYLDDLDARKSCVARLRLLGRLSLDQIALYLGLPQATIEHEWRFVRAWLAKQVGCYKL